MAAPRARVVSRLVYYRSRSSQGRVHFAIQPLALAVHVSAPAAFRLLLKVQ